MEPQLNEHKLYTTTECEFIHLHKFSSLAGPLKINYATVHLLCTIGDGDVFFSSKLPYPCQPYFRHDVGQALRNISCCNITFIVR